ncbi:M56 family metallopeptidase [Prescottella agglutinans]|uniref:Zn-dependent protease with chaperone function n=1 Tax=Prescottella agglutinans TaxID=1644129 RepID=A0ABT6M982_9NOCA|nr:M56 family metallopeptidase [Prescottella agglutinans]MDH6280871.1 Zn-dependent protease with chaperone function [Prescottella agglutinans]
MIAAIGLAVAAVVLGYASPHWLGLLAAPHRHPRVALAAWLSSQALFVGVVAAVPLALWVRPGDRWHLLPTSTLSCVNFLRENGTVPWVSAVEATLCGAGLLVIGRIVVVVSRTLLRHRRVTEEHASVLRLVGRPTLADGDDVFHLVGHGGAAYSIGGRSPAIVLGTGAIELDPSARAAVLAHERAHLTGRHHLLVAWADGLSAAVPVVPLARVGATWIRVLVELSADRHAATSCGSGAVCAALRSRSDAARGPRPVATSAAGFVEDRVVWLSGLRASRRGAQVLHYPLALTLSALPVLTTFSAVVAALAACCAIFGG